MSRVYPIPIVAPGSLGINRDQEFALLDRRWCIRATNAVLDRSGQLTARKGWHLPANQVAMASSPSVAQMFEYINASGTAELISAANNKIFKGWDVDFTNAAQDITSSTAPTANNWQFINFNGFCLAWQASHIAISRTTGDFANITAATGTLPTGNECHAAFGRVWATYADKQTIGYCALLDHTKWASGDGGGTIDMRKVWTRGMDEITAISSLGSQLIVYGKRHIILWADGVGSELGLDPTQMYVTDTIEGTGTKFRDSIVSIGEGDQLFLSPHGVQSLGRVIENKNNPVGTLTRNYTTQLSGLISTETATLVRAVHNPGEHLYVLLFPSSTLAVCLDTSQFMTAEDGSQVARITEWTFSPFPASIVQLINGDMLMGFNGRIGRYEGFQDNGQPYSYDYLSSWLLLDQQVEAYLKIVKEIDALVLTAGGYSVTFSWGFDFGVDSEEVTRTLTQGSQSEWGIAQYGIDEYSGGSTLQRLLNIDAAGEGQYLQVGVSTDINGYSFSTQRLQLMTKLGRLA